MLARRGATMNSFVKPTPKDKQHTVPKEPKKGYTYGKIAPLANTTRRQEVYVDCKFDDNKFNRAKFINCTFINCTFIQCEGLEVEFQGCEFKGGFFSNCEFDYSKFEMTSFRNFSFLDSTLLGIIFDEVNFIDRVIFKNTAMSNCCYEKFHQQGDLTIVKCDLSYTEYKQTRQTESITLIDCILTNSVLPKCIASSDSNKYSPYVKEFVEVAKEEKKVETLKVLAKPLSSSIHNSYQYPPKIYSSLPPISDISAHLECSHQEELI